MFGRLSKRRAPKAHRHGANEFIQNPIVVGYGLSQDLKIFVVEIGEGGRVNIVDEVLKAAKTLMYG